MQLYDDKIIILTGGAGFIGSCILKQLNNMGMNNILVVDELGEDDKWRNLVGKKFLEYIHKDKLFDWLNQKGIASEIEAVIHMGACSSTTEKNIDYLMENNYQYSLKLAEFSLKHNIRFIYASSAATYGDGSNGFSDDHDKLEILKPLNGYGFSKHVFDLWVKDQGVLDQVTGLKFFNVFGPNEFHKGRMGSVIFNLLPQVKVENVIRLFKSNDPKNFKDGEQKRDFVYVKDVAEIVVELLKRDIYGIYNIGTGQASTWNQVASGMFKAIGQKPNIEYRDMPQDLKGKYQNFTEADVSKLMTALETFEFTPLEDAIGDYINNYLAQNTTY